jgi:hypothetical protein
VKLSNNLKVKGQKMYGRKVYKRKNYKKITEQRKKQWKYFNDETKAYVGRKIGQDYRKPKLYDEKKTSCPISDEKKLSMVQGSIKACKDRILSLEHARGNDKEKKEKLAYVKQCLKDLRIEEKELTEKVA